MGLFSFILSCLVFPGRGHFKTCSSTFRVSPCALSCSLVVPCVPFPCTSAASERAKRAKRAERLSCVSLPVLVVPCVSLCSLVFVCVLVCSPFLFDLLVFSSRGLVSPLCARFPFPCQDRFSFKCFLVFFPLLVLGAFLVVFLVVFNVFFGSVLTLLLCFVGDVFDVFRRAKKGGPRNVF